MSGYQSDIAIPNVTTDVSEPVGVILDEQFDGTLANYIQTKPTSVITASGGMLHLSGGSGNFANHIQYNDTSNPHYITALSDWYHLIPFSAAALDNSSFGVGAGIKSINPDDPFDLCVRLAMDTGTFFGKFFIYALKDGVQSTVYESDDTFDLTALTNYWFYVQRKNMTIIMTLFAADGSTILKRESFTFDLKTVANSVVMHNTGRPTLWHLGGPIDAEGWQFGSNARKNVDVVACGDSNLAGQWVWDVSLTYFNQAMTSSRRSYEVLAGSADTVIQAYARRAEIVELIRTDGESPVIYLNYGSNEKAFGVPDNTWQTAYVDLVEYLQANIPAVTIIIAAPFARAGVTIAAVRDYLITTFAILPYVIIVDFYEFSKAAATTALSGPFNSSDNIHGNYELSTIAARKLLFEAPVLKG